VERKNICLVEHPRSGAHWVLKTIFVNFDTGFNDYWKDMFAGHKLEIHSVRKKFPDRSIILLKRNIYDTLASVWRMRERAGISLELSFSDFLRMNYSDMPRNPKTQCDIYFDEKLVKQATVSWIAQQKMTPPELWLATNQYWKQYADLIISYEQFTKKQETVLDSIQSIAGWKRKDEVMLTKTVGWKPPNNKKFKISTIDMQLLSYYADRFSEES
jgi:hypothetical protein